MVTQAMKGGEDLTEGQREAVEYAIRTHISDGKVVGLGSGPMVTYMIERIGDMRQNGEFKGCTWVPANDVAANECAFHGLPQTSWIDPETIDVLFEQVDEVDVQSPGWPFIFGRRKIPAQPQISRLQAIMERVDTLVGMLEDESGLSTRLGAELPVVITADANEWEDCAEEIDDIFLGDATIWRRPSNASAAVTGESELVNGRGGPNPYVSSEGHTIIDIIFDEHMQLFGEDVSYEKIVKTIMSVPGAISVGLIEGKMRHCIVPTVSKGLMALDYELTKQDAKSE